MDEPSLLELNSHIHVFCNIKSHLCRDVFKRLTKRLKSKRGVILGFRKNVLVYTDAEKLLNLLKHEEKVIMTISKCIRSLLQCCWVIFPKTMKENIHISTR